MSLIGFFNFCFWSYLYYLKRCEHRKNSQCGPSIDSSENKNSKIYSKHSFFIPKSYLIKANFQAIWSRNRKALRLRLFFQNSSQNPVFLPAFYLNFCSGSQCLQMPIKSEPTKVRRQMSTF